MFIHALSLTQPWATLWDGVHKRYETRSWGTKHRGLLAIHASAHFPREVQALCRTEPFWSTLRALGVHLRWTTPPPEVLPLGVVVALTVLTVCAQIAEILPSNEAGGGLRVRLTRGGIWDISPQEAAFGTFAPGRWL
jgi:hypothetical protein